MESTRAARSTSGPNLAHLRCHQQRLCAFAPLRPCAFALNALSGSLAGNGPIRLIPERFFWIQGDFSRSLEMILSMLTLFSRLLEMILSMLALIGRIREIILWISPVFPLIFELFFWICRRFVSFSGGHVSMPPGGARLRPGEGFREDGAILDLFLRPSRPLVHVGALPAPGPDAPVASDDLAAAASTRALAPRPSHKAARGRRARSRDRCASSSRRGSAPA